MNENEKIIRNVTMKSLGFTEKWPGGTAECWWESPKGLDQSIDFGNVRFTKLPTKEYFWAIIAMHFREQGLREAREPLRKALQDLNI